jgi:molecular chaperone HtpG
MVDTIDEWALRVLQEFDEKRLVSATEAELDLGEDKAEDESEEEDVELSELRTRIADVLSDNVSEVRVSKRLSDSPACLVTPSGRMNAHIEAVLRANGQDVPKSKRIFEINPNHALITGLENVREKSPGSEAIQEWIELLYDQAVLAEGMPLENPARLASRMTRLMQSAIEAGA